MRRLCIWPGAGSPPAILIFAVLGICLVASGCDSPRPPATGGPREQRLRVRVELAASYFMKGDFTGFHSMGSQRHRREVLGGESEVGLEASRREFEMFVRQEQPLLEPLRFEIRNGTARVKTRVSVRRPDGSRFYATAYDHWVFENGDWFLDEMGRTE